MESIRTGEKVILLIIALLSGGVEVDSFRYTPASIDLSNGKFLVATRQLIDPRFVETVVLLVRYDKEGALGLIVNRPTKANLSDALPDLPNLKNVKETLFMGGPVDLSRMFLLLLSTEPPKDSLRVFGHVYLSSSKEVLEKRIPIQGGKEKLRVYAGYSGWGAGQLESEIQRGDWNVWHADTEIIFNMPSKEVWPEMIRRSTVLEAATHRR
jgi:putative transcriptional regulator